MRRQTHTTLLRCFVDTVSTNSVVVLGMLQPDGTIRLDHPPALPPGPMEVTLRPIRQQRERLPDLPFDDSSAPPPCDLPRDGTARPIQPIRVLQRLPDPIQSVDFA